MGTIDPRPEQMHAFLAAAAGTEGPVAMINLLRYRDEAAYPNDSDASPCSGREAYRRYAVRVAERVASVGGELIFEGGALATLIAPEGESWHDALIIRYPSPQAFLEMVQQPEYREIAVHRTAALADSRLIATLPGGSSFGASA